MCIGEYACERGCARLCVRADARDFARVFVCIYSVVYILKLGSVRRFEGRERRNKKRVGGRTVSGGDGERLGERSARDRCGGVRKNSRSEQ